jgi:hypothetical protein
MGWIDEGSFGANEYEHHPPYLPGMFTCKGTHVYDARGELLSSTPGKCPDYKPPPIARSPDVKRSDNSIVVTP